MKCREIKNLIPLFLDGVLREGKILHVREHLRGCAACRKELAAFEQSWAMLKERESIQPRPGYISRFWTRVSEETSWQERVGKGLREGLWSRRLAPAFVAACLVIVIGIFAVRNYCRIQDTDQTLANLGEDEIEMVKNMELAENFDLIEDMDFWEDMEVIENIDSLEII